jgi:hypothetical protein
MARYRKEDHAKKKPAAAKPKAKSSAPSSTGRRRKPVDPKATAVGQAMQDAAAAKGTTIDEAFPQPTPTLELPEVASALKVANVRNSKKRYPNTLSEDYTHHVTLSAMMDNLESKVNAIRKEDPFTGKTELRGTNAKATKQVLNILGMARTHAENALNAHLNNDSLSAAPHFLKATDMLHEALTHADNTIASQTVLNQETGRITPELDEVGVRKRNRSFGGFLTTFQTNANTISIHPMDTPKQLTELANGYVDHALKSEFGENNTDIIELAKKEGNLSRTYKEGESSPSFSDVDRPGIARTLSSAEEAQLMESRQARQEKETVDKAMKNSMAGRTKGGVKFPVEVQLPAVSESKEVLASRARYVEAKKAEVEGDVLEERGKTKYTDVFTPWDKEKAINEHRLQTRAIREKAFQVWNLHQELDAKSKQKAFGKIRNIPDNAKTWMRREPSTTWVGSPAWSDPESFLVKMAVKEHWMNSGFGSKPSHEFEGTDAAKNPEAYIEKNGLKHTGWWSNKLVSKDSAEPGDIREGRSTEGMATPLKENAASFSTNSAGETSNIDTDEAKEAEFNKMSRGARNTAAFQEGGRK